MARAGFSAALFFAAALATGCSGSVSTQRLTEETLAESKGQISGIVYYPPALFAEMTVKTALVRDGKLIGRASESPPICNEVTVEKVVMLPDLQDPHAIQYRPGTFETNTFGVSLKDGMLAAVNSQPGAAERGNLFPGLAAASPLGPAAAPMGMLVADGGVSGGYLRRTVVPDELPACNDGPVISGYRRIELPPRARQNSGPAGR